MKKLIFFSTLVLLIFFISSCHPSRVIIRERPPEPHYIQPIAPGPNYIWHGGDWIRHENSYVYRKGYWIATPSNHRHYIAGHWQRRRGGWIWVSGHWH